MTNSEWTPCLLDTDILVAASRVHYHPEFCQLFWDWLEAGHAAGFLYSVDKVKAELTSGAKDDWLRAWSQRPSLKSFFLPTAPCTGAWKDIATWATSKTPAFTNQALTKFLDAEAADAWLVAFAKLNEGFRVVTNEVSAAQSKKDVKLPDAAIAQGVRTLSLRELLGLHARNNFAFGMFPQIGGKKLPP